MLDKNALSHAGWETVYRVGTKPGAAEREERVEREETELRKETEGLVFDPWDSQGEQGKEAVFLALAPVPFPSSLLGRVLQHAPGFSSLAARQIGPRRASSPRCPGARPSARRWRRRPQTGRLLALSDSAGLPPAGQQAGPRRRPAAFRKRGAQLTALLRSGMSYSSSGNTNVCRGGALGCCSLGLSMALLEDGVMARRVS